LFFTFIFFVWELESSDFFGVLALNNGVGRLPPMGVSSWCVGGPCGNDYCSDKEMREIAQAVVSSGLKSLGYIYVNMDDCWAGPRDKQGNITPDPTRFPNGMKPLVDFIHSLGLKVGLYTDGGTETCVGHRPGSYGHYQQDANTYAAWGIDYVKMDWCHTKGLDPKIQYPLMRDALNKTGRPIFFEMCEWGLSEPWTWAAPVANSWRTTDDHHDSWNSTATIIEQQAGLSHYSGPGAWNYMDFLMTGGEGCLFFEHKHCSGQTDIEYRTEFSFWALLNSPLIVSTDIRVLTPIMKEVLFNTEVIAVNQDPFAQQGDRISNRRCEPSVTATCQVWAKPLVPGNKFAVILYNSADSKSYDITVKFSNLGWPGGTKALVRDLWKHEDVGIFKDIYTAHQVPPHGVTMVTLSQR
jgi:alpha-galactosidase